MNWKKAYKYLLLMNNADGTPAIEMSEIEEWYEGIEEEYREYCHTWTTQLEAFVSQPERFNEDPRGSMGVRRSTMGIYGTWYDYFELLEKIRGVHNRRMTVQRYDRILALDLSEFEHYVERLNKYSPFLEEYHEYRYIDYDLFAQFESDCRQFQEYVAQHGLTPEVRDLVLEIVDGLQYVLQDMVYHGQGNHWDPLLNFDEMIDKDEEEEDVFANRIRRMISNLLEVALS